MVDEYPPEAIYADFGNLCIDYTLTSVSYVS